MRFQQTRVQPRCRDGARGQRADSWPRPLAGRFPSSSHRRMPPPGGSPQVAGSRAREAASGRGSSLWIPPPGPLRGCEAGGRAGGLGSSTAPLRERQRERERDQPAGRQRKRGWGEPGGRGAVGGGQTQQRRAPRGQRLLGGGTGGRCRRGGGEGAARPGRVCPLPLPAFLWGAEAGLTAQGGPRAQGLRGRSSPPSANRACSGSGLGWSSGCFVFLRGGRDGDPPRGSVERELEWPA